MLSEQFDQSILEMVEHGWDEEVARKALLMQWQKDIEGKGGSRKAQKQFEKTVKVYEVRARPQRFRLRPASTKWLIVLIITPLSLHVRSENFPRVFPSRRVLGYLFALSALLYLSHAISK